VPASCPFPPHLTPSPPLLPVSPRSPQLCIATAIVFFHRFFVRKSFKDYDYFITAITCLLLGGKVEETPKKLKDVIAAYHQHRFPTEEPLAEHTRPFETLREMVLVHERVLLQTLGFDLQLEHPYRPLLAYVKAVGTDRAFAQIAWNYVNDSLLTTVCLQYDPSTVAAGCLYLADAHWGKESQLKHPEDPSLPWYHAFSVTSPEDMYAVSAAILDVIERAPEAINNAAKLRKHADGEANGTAHKDKGAAPRPDGGDEASRKRGAEDAGAHGGKRPREDVVHSTAKSSAGDQPTSHDTPAVSAA